MTLQEILSKIQNTRNHNGYFTGKCPAHSDEKNSLKISEQATGKITLTCFAGCDIEAICAGIGFEVKELYPPEPDRKSKIENQKSEMSRRAVCDYLYCDETDSIVFKKTRYEIEKLDGTIEKSFLIFRYENGKWQMGIGDARRVLYNLADIMAADRVFLCEGEKDADNLANVGFVTTTNFEGAATWRNEYNQFFENKDVVLVIDNDIAGLQRVEKLKANLINVKSLKIFNPFANEPPSQKHGKDISDWIDARDSKTCAEIQAEIETILEALPFEILQDAPLKANETFRNDYRLKDTGLYHITYEKDSDLNSVKERETWICSPITLVCWTRDKDSGNWGRFTKFNDSDGKEHKIVLPVQSLQGDGADAINVLSEQGLLISRKHKGKLLDYLLMADNGERATCVTSIGWHDDAFVFPDVTFSNSNEQLILQNIDLISNKFKCAGTLEQWQENISSLARGNSRLIFAISCAFAACLMPIANEQSGGFHIRGDSSTGKSTALFVAGSVWGGDGSNGFRETWRATSNGFEIVAQSHNHSLLLLDEMKQANCKDVGDIIYTLANGFGKNRMTKSISARQKLQWQLLFLSSGELTLSDFIGQNNERIYGGQEARFVDIEADAGAGFGLFENLHTFANGADFSKHLVKNSCRYYGTAIREFLPKLIENRKNCEQYLQAIQQNFTNKIYKTDANAAGEILRVASRFALIGAAGEIATGFGITKWQPLEALQSVERLFDEWIEWRGGMGNLDVQLGVDQVISWLQSNNHRIASNENSFYVDVNNLAGFRDAKVFGETVYFIFPKIFRHELCKGYDYKKIAKALAKRGQLFLSNNGEIYRKERLQYWKDGKPDNFYVLSLLTSEERQNNP